MPYPTNLIGLHRVLVLSRLLPGGDIGNRDHEPHNTAANALRRPLESARYRMKPETVEAVIFSHSRSSWESPPGHFGVPNPKTIGSPGTASPSFSHPHSGFHSCPVWMTRFARLVIPGVPRPTPSQKARIGPPMLLEGGCANCWLRHRQPRSRNMGETDKVDLRWHIMHKVETAFLLHTAAKNHVAATAKPARVEYGRARSTVRWPSGSRHRKRAQNPTRDCQSAPYEG